jgi:hypothetical protein
MEKFDKYDEVDYTGKSDPDVWETHVEFYLSKQTALARYAEIKRLHPEAAKQHALRPFFRKTGEINLHRDMIKDLGSGDPASAKGVWQLEYWLPSTARQAADFESRMTAKDPQGWSEHRRREKREWDKPADQRT